MHLDFVSLGFAFWDLRIWDLESGIWFPDFSIFYFSNLGLDFSNLDFPIWDLDFSGLDFSGSDLDFSNLDLDLDFSQAPQTMPVI